MGAELLGDCLGHGAVAGQVLPGGGGYPVCNLADIKGPKYGLVQLIKLQMDLMTGFSFLPLRFLSWFGAVVALFAFVLSIYILVMRLIRGDAWAAFGVFTLFAALFMMVGGLFIGMGILGEYVGRIYGEVRQRPRFVVRKVHGSSE